MGARWYYNDNFFARFRGLIGDNEASLGAGYARPINNDWRFEAMGNLYFKGQFALRAEVAYVLK